MDNHSQRATPNSQLLTRNPYVGPRAFEAADRANFFGRDMEIRQLADLVVAQRAVLLYASSGAGKTSLINAGLIPALQRRRMTALPVARVGGSAPAEVANPFVFNLLSSLADETVAPETLLKMSLREGLSPGSPLALDVASGARLLVLDQFEELFTQHAGRPAAREDFFAQLQDALEVFPHLGLLLAMREEYLAYLDSFSAMLPDRLRARFRLELLGESAARLALQAPARAAGVPFDDDAARHLVDDLRRVQVQQLDGSTVSALGPAVEPVQLQVVAYRLWESLPPGADHIGVDALAGLGDVNRALRDYYAQSVARIAAETGVAERAIREWVERQLITAQGRRDVVARGPESSGGLKNAAIGRLVGVHLVRPEQRAGTTWYELAHDRLVEPLQADNAAWFAEHLSLLQRQAALWDEEKRPAGLLLSGDALAEAEAWAARCDGDLNATERDFLAACREAQARARREQQQTRRIRWLAVAATVLMLVAIVAAFFAWGQMQRAETAQSTAETRRIEAENAQSTAVAEAHIRATAQAETEAQRIEAVNAQATAEARRVEAENAKTTAEARRIEAEAAQREAVDQARLGRIVRARELAALAQSLEDPTGSLNLMLARESALTTWLTDTTIITHSFVTNETLAALNYAVFNAERSSQSFMLWRASHLFAAFAAYSPDGTRIVSGGRFEGKVQVWDAQSGALLNTLAGHTNRVNAVAYSPDGTRIVSGSWDGTVRVWDAQSGATLHILTEPDLAKAVAYSPDGTRIASGSYDGTIRVWDAQSGTILNTLTGHTKIVNSVAYNPDGARIVSGSWDGTVRVWDAQSGAALLILKGHPGAVNSVAYSPDGTRIVSGGDFDETIRVWDAQSGALLSILTGHTSGVCAVAYSLDGTRIASGSNDGTIRVWDAQSGALLNTLTEHTGAVATVAFSPDGTRIASGSNDGTLRVWYVQSDAELHTLTSQLTNDGDQIFHRPGGSGSTLKGPGYFTSVTYSPDGTRILGVGHDNFLQIWNVQSRAVLYTSDMYIASAGYSPDGTRIVSGDIDGTVHVLDAQSWMVVQQLAGHTDFVRAVAYSPDGTRIVSGGGDKTVRVWDAKSGVELHILTGHTGTVIAVAYSPDGTRIVSSSTDKTLRVWDAQSGAELHTLAGHTGWVNAVAYSPDGTRLVSGGDVTVRVWDAQSGAELHTLAGHTQTVRAVAYSPDGTRIVSGSQDGTVREWDTQSDVELLTLAGLDDVRSVAYSPDGTHIVTGDSDGMIWIWNTSITLQSSADKLQMAQCAGHDGWVHVAAYHDGQPVLITSDDKTRQMFLEDTDYLLRLADCLIQRDPPMFTEEERSLYRFDQWPAVEH